VSALFIAFAHAYPLQPAPNSGAELTFQKDQPDQAGRLNKIMYFARRANPNIKFIISLGWGMQDWTYISFDYTSGKNIFPKSVLAFVRQYQLDGFDIDDEAIGNDPGPNCSAPSGCITQESFNGVIRNLRSLFDSASKPDGKPYYLTITPADGRAHVTKDNMANFDLINPQCYGGSDPSDFTEIGYPAKQLSWGIDTEDTPVYPTKAQYQPLAGIFDWSMSADRNQNPKFKYTNQIARDVGYPPAG
jgi:chitinase